MIKKVSAALMAIAIGAGIIVGASAPASASTSAAIANNCVHGQYFGPGDQRLAFHSTSSSHYWYAPKYHAGDCNGVFVTFYGHSPNGETTDGYFRIRTFESDGTTTHLVTSWVRLSWNNGGANLRSSISVNRIFRVEEIAANCIVTVCGSDERPVFNVDF